MAVLSLNRNGTFGDDDYWYHADIRLSMLSPMEKSSEEQRVKLVYGTIGTDSVLRHRIDQFNKENTEYYIELRNYAGENVERRDLFRSTEARDAALTRLNAEVASGQIPDIWDTSLPIALYARKGVLEDLWPYIDNDPEINREDLMSHVLDCASVDGKLYQIFNVFDIYTAAAPSAVVGNRTSWTLEEMMEYYDAMPEGSSLMGYSYSKIGLLSNLLYYNLNTWINWSTGECRFDTESFKNLLSLCEQLGTDGSEYDAELQSNEDNGVYLREGRQLCEIAHLSGPEDLLIYDSVMGGPQHITDYGTYLNENNIFDSFYDENGNKRSEDELCCLVMGYAWIKDGKFEGTYAITSDAVVGAVEGGGYADYIGMPSDRGSGSNFLLPFWFSYVEGQWGISAVCQAKDGAWAYIRQFLLPHGSGKITIDDMTYTSTGFPINRADFDALFAPVWFQRKDGEYALDQEGRQIEEPRDVIGVNLYSQELETAMILYQLAPNELQMERFWDLYNAIDNVSVGDSAIMNIIEEQAAVYFAGDKPLDETADLIQRRVRLYVNENR